MENVEILRDYLIGKRNYSKKIFKAFYGISRGIDKERFTYEEAVEFLNKCQRGREENAV